MIHLDEVRFESNSEANLSQEKLYENFYTKLIEFGDKFKLNIYLFGEPQKENHDNHNNVCLNSECDDLTDPVTEENKENAEIQLSVLQQDEEEKEKRKSAVKTRFKNIVNKKVIMPKRVTKKLRVVTHHSSPSDFSHFYTKFRRDDPKPTGKSNFNREKDQFHTVEEVSKQSKYLVVDYPEEEAEKSNSEVIPENNSQQIPYVNFTPIEPQPNKEIKPQKRS